MPDNKLRAISHGSLIIDKIFLNIVDLIRTKHKTGLTEIQIGNFIKSQAKKLGASGMAFRPTIVAFGRGSSDVHHWPTKQKIGRDNFLMLDYGVKVKGFCSDFTRTLFLGRPNKLHEQIYNIVLTAQKTAINKLAVGKFGDEIDFAARHIINQAGYGRKFTHGAGHGVTKQIHDKPSFKPHSGDVVRSGDVVTIEPGIYLPGKFGVRIEDMVLVGPKKKIFSRIGKDFQDMIIKL